MQYIILFKKVKVQKKPTELTLTATSDQEALDKEARIYPDFKLTNLNDYEITDQPTIKMRTLTHKNCFSNWKWI